MQHLDLLIRKHPELRKVDYQRLVQRVKEDPQSHWNELVEHCAPIVYAMAQRLAGGQLHRDAVAEQATQELFESLKDDDYARIRSYVGFGKWPSLLLQWTSQCEALREIQGEEHGLAAPDERTERLLAEEGQRFVEHMELAIGRLHRRDRLLLGMRYEQKLSLPELDHVFRLGSPDRIQSLLDRIGASLQPLTAVGDAWQLEADQQEAVLAYCVEKIFASGSQESSKDENIAEAIQQR
jgi:DNA-directed RNA polymerase specialized sigma subunit